MLKRTERGDQFKAALQIFSLYLYLCTTLTLDAGSCFVLAPVLLSAAALMFHRLVRLLYVMKIEKRWGKFLIYKCLHTTVLEIVKFRTLLSLISLNTLLSLIILTLLKRNVSSVYLLSK